VANRTGVPGSMPGVLATYGTIFSTGHRQPASDVIAMDADMICRNRRRDMPSGASMPPGNSCSIWLRKSSVSASSCRLRQ
jgi:hypothetical protein